MGSWLGRITSRDTGIRGNKPIRGDALVGHELDQENVAVGHYGPGDGENQIKMKSKAMTVEM